MLSNRQVFYHDIMNCTNDEVVGNYLYSGRALGPNDVIQLHSDTVSQWDYISDHYDQIGLVYSHSPVWDVSIERLNSYKDFSLSVFFFDKTIHQSHPNEEWLNVVRYINSKNNFMALAKTLSMDVPVTHCFMSKYEVTDLECLPYPCYAKAAVSVSGVGIYRCEDQAELKVALEKFDDHTPLQVQEEIESQTFLNVQYHVTEQGLQRLAITEQILDGFTHIGNRYPSYHQPWEAVDPMAKWMYLQGIKGIFAFDVAVVKQENHVRYMPIECNPRFNGASYPTGIAMKLGLTHWFAEQISTQKRSLSQVDLTDIEYNPKTKTGIILVNWGSILVGKLGVLISGTPEMQMILRKELHRRLAAD